MRKLHKMTRFSKKWTTCGYKLDKKHATTDPEKVTCLKCLKHMAHGKLLIKMIGRDNNF